MSNQQNHAITPEFILRVLAAFGFDKGINTVDLGVAA